mgnify:CR=1 FL=1
MRSHSAHRGTDKVTELLTEAMDGEKRRISLLPEKEDYSRHVFKSGDICFIGSSFFWGKSSSGGWSKRLGMMKGNQARAVLVCVYGNRAYEDTLIELKDVADKAGFVPAAAVATIAEHSIMHKFAAGRPDETDQKTTGVGKGQENIWNIRKNRRAQCSGKSSLQRAGDDSFYSEAGKSMQFLRTVRGALSGGRY